MKYNWEKCKIGDICNSVSETYKGSDEKVVLINTSDVLEGIILNHNKVDNKNLKGQFKKTFQKNDILYSEIRPANKRFAFVNIEDTYNYIASTKLMVIRPCIDKVLPEYLYMLLKSQSLINELQHLAETRSGTFPQITFSSELAPMQIILPPVETQRKIVKVLSDIDDKIELNNSLNNNLEQQAIALYDDLISRNKENLKEISLSDIANITMGQSPNGSSYNEDGSGTVFYQGRAEFGFRYPTRRLYTTEPKRMAYYNDVLMSVRAPVGDINVAYEDCCIGRGLAAIQSKINTPSFILYTMYNLKKDLNIFNGEGTIFGSVNKDSLNSLKLNIPSREEILKFEQTVAPLDKLIENNYRENTRLIQLRDTLLPKLMSGEIDVSNVDISTDKLSFSEDR